MLANVSACRCFLIHAQRVPKGRVERHPTPGRRKPTNRKSEAETSVVCITRGEREARLVRPTARRFETDSIPVSATSVSTTYLRLGDHGRPPILGPNFPLWTTRFLGNFLAALIVPSQHRPEHGRLRAVPGASELPLDDAR